MLRRRIVAVKGLAKKVPEGARRRQKAPGREARLDADLQARSSGCVAVCGNGIGHVVETAFTTLIGVDRVIEIDRVIEG